MKKILLFIAILAGIFFCAVGFAQSVFWIMDNDGDQLLFDSNGKITITTTSN